MSEPLRFERVSIQRMPGFEESGGFTLDGLSPSINVIQGPNASGKTSSAKALEALLWPRSVAEQRLLLVGRFRLGGAEWSVDLHGTRALYQREGVEVGPPNLPSEAERDRYRLSLPDLLAVDNPYYADAIHTETAGGYDVVKAGEPLAPRSSASRSRNELEALESAKAARAEAVARQEELRGEEKRVAELVARREKARAAALRVGVLERAIEHAGALEKLATARDALAIFPAEMAKLRGDEQEQLAKLAAQRAAVETALARAETQRREARAAIVETALPELGVAPELLLGLRADLATLGELRREIGSAESAREAARVRLDMERRRLGGTIDDARLAVLDYSGVEGLARFARLAAELRGEDLALQAAEKALGASEPVDDPRPLAEGIGLLQRWLRETGGSLPADARNRTLALAGGGLLLISGLALAAVTPWALALSAIGATLLVAILLAPTEEAAGDRDVRRRDYSQMEIEQPGEWTAEAVRALLERLLERHAAAVLAARRADERRGLRLRREELAPRLAELDAHRSAIAERLGMDPAIEEGHLVWVAETVGRWQAAHGDFAAAEEVLRSANARAESLGVRLGERLSPFGYTELETLGAMEGAVEALGSRDQRLRKARSELSASEEAVERLRGDGRGKDAERRAIFDRVGLQPEDDHTLRTWCDQLPSYRQSADALREAEIAATGARRRLSESGADDALFHADPQELARSLLEARTEAAAFEILVTEIGQIEKAIEDAKRGHRIEEAQARVAQCEAKLAEARERDTRSIVAHVLIEHLKQATREQHLPAVFHRAKQILSRITHGRYDLRFGGEGEAEFSAYDNVEGRGRRLSELSSGTRVQLLLAVRIAFIEMQEREAKLPIVLDEVLGNSDDERAWAIIEAVVELACAGRQVFYLTAQADEVRKWEAALERSPGVELRVIDLASARKLQRVIEVPDSFSVASSTAATIPEPAGMTHTEYGRALGVPAVEPLTGRAGGLHLWYLIERPDELYPLLRVAERWGALEGTVRNGGGALVERAVYARASALALAAERFLEAQRVGIGRPVDRLVLQSAGAISEKFINGIESISKRCGGDARQLITEMKAREAPEMKGFLVRNTERFQEYLEEHGYLPDQDPLDNEELLSRTLAAVAAEVRTGVISIDEVHRLIARLRLGCASARA